jgi:hypothetical protein
MKKKNFSIIILFSTFTLTAIGGDEEDRTPDPLLARQVLSQLSYTPIQKSEIRV